VNVDLLREVCWRDGILPCLQVSLLGVERGSAGILSRRPLWIDESWRKAAATGLRQREEALRSSAKRRADEGKDQGPGLCHGTANGGGDEKGHR